MAKLDGSLPDADPYQPPMRASSPPSPKNETTDRSAILGVTAAFSIPAAALLVLAFLSFGFDANGSIVGFFLHGLHTPLLAALFLAAVVLILKVAHNGRPAAIIMSAFLGPIYVVTLITSWLLVAFWVWWKSTWFP